MTTLGAVFLPQLPPERLKALAVTADNAGLSELWLWEDCFLEGGVSAIAAALAWTQNLRVGIGVLPMPLRNVALTAMEISTLDRLFPGRAIIGVGHGVQEWMAQVGEKVASPLTLMREYFTALQSLLAAESVTVEGRYIQLENVKLDWPPLSKLAIHAAATGPKSLRLAGELADGTVLSAGSTPETVRQARVLIDEGRAIAGRLLDDHTLTVYVFAATGPGCTDRLAAECRRWNFDPSQDIGVAGDGPAVADAVARWVDAGADTVVLQPSIDDPDPEGFLRFVATEVAPLIDQRS